MAFRTPRGYAVNRPYFNELCEGVRPNSQALPRKAYTGLPHVRIDEFHHDPIVIDAGTIVGMPTGNFVGAGTFVPAVLGSGAAGFGNATGLMIIGSTEASTEWGLPSGTEARLNVGNVKPMGVVFQPIYSFILESRYTNYKRTASTGILTDYVIQIPVTNDEEAALYEGDVVMLGSGIKYGAGVTSTWSTNKLAGRYAKYDSTAQFANERVVGRVMKRLLLGNISGASAGDLLASNLSSFTISSAASAEFSDLAKVQTVPGLELSGSGTKGIPGFFLGARADASGNVWALTMLIRL